MKKGKVIPMLLVLLMMSTMVSFVIAQEDVGIVAGLTTTSDMLTEDIEPSSSLGGMVSAISSNFERYVNFGAVKVWKEGTSSPEMNFDVLIFQANAVPDFGHIVVGSVFETSENVEIRGVTGIWETKNIVSNVMGGADTQPLNSLNDVMTFDDASWIKIKTDTGTQSTFDYQGGSNAILDWGIADLCPTVQQLLDVYGITATSIKRALPGEIGGAIVCRVVNGGGTKYLIDKNKDGSFVFMNTIAGYKASAQDGQVLSILPVGTYDVFGILP